MAVTPAQRESIFELLVLMFDAAPGATYLPLIEDAYLAAGSDLQALAAILAATPVFADVHSEADSAEAFATAFLDPLGLAGDAFARDFVIARLEAGQTYGEVIHTAWAALHDLPEGALAQYAAAKAIMENKALVAAHYTLELQGSATDIASLQAVIALVDDSQASVEAVFDALDDELATGPALTNQLDVLSFDTTEARNITGIVDGDADKHTGGSTYTQGDAIYGNGNTNLLLKVAESGHAGDAKVEDVETIAIASDILGHVTFDASGWTRVGELRLADAVDGFAVKVSHLEAGIELAVDGIEGTIAASIDRGAGIDLRLVNAAHGETSRALVDRNGGLSATLGEGSSLLVAGSEVLSDIDVEAAHAASIDVHLEDMRAAAAFGNVELHAGDAAFLRVFVDVVDGSLAFGDVQVEAAIASTSVLQARHIDGDFAADDVLLAGGDYAQLTIRDAGNVSIGDVDLIGGTASITLADVDSVSVGDLHLDAGEGHQASALVDAIHGDLQIGDVHLGGALASQVNVLVLDVSGDASLGRFDASAGDAARIALRVAGVDGSLHFGGATAQAGDEAALDVKLAADEDLQIGALELEAAHRGEESIVLRGDAMEIASVAMGAGDDSVLQLDAEAKSSIDVGPIALVAGDRAEASLLLAMAASGEAGALLAGTLSADVGVDAQVAIHAGLALGWSASDTAPAIGALAVSGVRVSAGENASIDIGFTQQASGTGSAEADAGDFSVGNIDIDAGDEADIDIEATRDGAFEPGGAFELGAIHVSAGDHSYVRLRAGDGNHAGLGDFTFGGVNLAAGTDSHVSAGVTLQKWDTAGDIGDVDAGDVVLDLGERSQGSYAFALAGATAQAQAGAFRMGDIALSLATSATADVQVDFDSLAVLDGAHVGAIDVGVLDGASANVSLQIGARNAAGDMTVGDVDLSVGDAGITVPSGTGTAAHEVPLGGSIRLDITLDSDASDSLTVGDIAIDVAGTAAGDEAAVFVSGGGDVILGDIRVAGAGAFVLDAMAHTATSDANTSFISIQAGGDITVGDIDFSAYENDITLDLSWVDHGAAHISGGSGNDLIGGTSGNNVVSGGGGVDVLDIRQGGVDTLRFREGDSGTAVTTIDSVIGFSGGTDGAGDKLAFGLSAGSAGSYAEGAGAASFADFLQDATDALNSSVIYFAEAVGGDLLVAVSYGTGEADLVIRLVGAADLGSIGWQNFVA